MSQPERIPLYLTEQHNCSYLPDELAQTAFVDPTVTISAPVYSSLNQQGFRRSGEYFYRPQCGACKSCKSLRVPVTQFVANRSQQRCKKMNASLTTKVVKEANIWDYYELYCRYLKLRHSDGDMYPPNPNQYESFLGAFTGFVQYVEYYLDGQLIMVSVMDELPDAISAIYTFFDPSFQKRSLGSYAILWQINHARERRIPYVYLGFWIENCDKMNYKSNFKPHQILDDGAWKNTENN